MGNIISSIFSDDKPQYDAITESAVKNLNKTHAVKTSAVSTIGDVSAITESTNKSAVTAKHNTSVVKAQTSNNVFNDISDISAVTMHREDLTSEEKEQALKIILQELEKQEEDLKAAYAADHARLEQLKAELAEKQKKISEQRMQELEDAIERARLRRENFKETCIKASQLVCALICNYQNGTIKDPDLDPNWENNTNKLIKDCVKEDVFKLLCSTKELLPLLWFTGPECSKYHSSFKPNAKGIVEITPALKDYYKNNITDYVKNHITEYVYKVLTSNCNDLIISDSIINSCKQYLTEAEKCITIDDFTRLTHTFLTSSEQFILRTQMLTARADKRPTTEDIHVLPTHYPHYSSDLELALAILYLTNTITNQYGVMQDANGIMFKNTSSDKNKQSTAGELSPPSGHNYGGCCYKDPVEINNVITKLFNRYAQIDKDEYFEVWTFDYMDLTGDISGFNHKGDSVLSDFYKYTKTIHLSAHIAYQDANEEGGYYKFSNPTQKYTKLFINDEDSIEKELTTPRLSAYLLERKEGFIKRICTNLNNNEDFDIYCTHKINNGWMLSRFDLINLVPDELNMGSDVIPPMSRFMFDTLVKNICKWDLIISLEDNMNFHYINTNLYRTYGSEEFYPQTLYAANGKWNGLLESGSFKAITHNTVNDSAQTFKGTYNVSTIAVTDYIIEEPKYRLMV